MASEIREEKEEDDDDDEVETNSFSINAETQILVNIRRILQYQKSLYNHPSSSSSSSSSFSSTRKSSSLLELMKEGSTSLRRLFDMEHTTLKNYFHDYSGSPIIKPILLWGSDTDHDHDPYWMSLSIKQACNKSMDDSRSHSQTWMASESIVQRPSKRRLPRTKSFRKLPPRFRFWICGGRGIFRFRPRFLRRLRIFIRGRKF